MNYFVHREILDEQNSLYRLSFIIIWLSFFIDRTFTRSSPDFIQNIVDTGESLQQKDVDAGRLRCSGSDLIRINITDSDHENIYSFRPVNWIYNTVEF